MKKTIIAFITAITLSLSFSANAGYPNGPVQFLIPWPPGDFEDILTRMIADEWKKETGSPASVVNRPGGGDGPFPGALEVLDAPADGSVIGSFVIGVPIVGPRIDIGIESDSFEPVGIFLTYPFVLAASGSASYSNLSELAAHAKNNDVVLGHFGAGLVPTKVTFAAAKKLGFEFADESAFDMLDCNSLSAGDADVINTTLALVEPCLNEIKILGNIGEERIGKLPNVATVAEQAGVNNIELWNGLFVKKGTPQEVKDKIASIASKAMLGDEAQALMKETGARVYWQGASESEERIASDIKKFDEINAMLK